MPSTRPLWFRVLRSLVVALVFLAGGLTAFGLWLSAAPGDGYASGEPLPPATAEHKATAGRLEADVKKLALEIGARDIAAHPEQLKLTADFIASRLQGMGYTPQRRPFTTHGGGVATGGKPVENIDATLTGSVTPDELIVVGAHYDTVPTTPGADDNATGVAALLEIARRLRDHKPERSVRFVAFVNEEPPYFKTDEMGSLVYARALADKKEKVVAMISLEMLGTYLTEPGSQSYPPLIGGLYPDRGDFVAFVSDLDSRDLARQSIESFRKHAQLPSEILTAPAAIQGVDFSDHWSFWQAGYRGVMVTDTAFFRTDHYHKPTDTPDRLDFDRMSRVVVGMASVITDLAKAGAAP